MTDKELEQWWEEDSGFEAFATSDPPGPETSGDSISIWGDIGTIGTAYAPSQYEIDQIIQTNFDSLKKFKRADEWICVLRHANESKNILSCVQASEKLMYESKTSLKLKNEYSANPSNQLYFNVFRAYARADEENFDAAENVWNEIVYSWLDQVDEYRQPYILFHLFIKNMCINEWKKAIECLNQMWSLIKFMEPNKRHALGIWDEWVSALLVTWTFLQKCPDFNDVFCQDFDYSRLFEFQKKSLLLPHLHPNFLASFITESYYKKARQLNPELPEIEYKEKPDASLRL